MSGFEESAPPPELPEEYSDVYRDAYRRAYGDSGMPEPGDDERDGAGPLLPAGAALRSARFGPLLAGGLVVLLVCAVLGLKLVASDPEPGSSTVAPRATAEPDASPSATAPPSSTPSATPAPTSLASSWDGPVVPADVQDVTATCAGAPSVDSAGNPVRYDAENALDQDPTTAWRCDGQALGETLTLVLMPGTPVAEVGLIPGYAKTDPVDGADRFAENNRITRVRWTFDDGTSVVQELDPSQRTVQPLRVPRTATGTVVLEILAVEVGSRNRTAISEIAVSAAD